MTSRLPAVQPPRAPPRALPRVVVMMSTRPATPQCSKVPRPVRPMNPVAWESSTRTRRPVTIGQVADLLEGCDVAVHREHAVGHDHAEAGGGRLAQLRLQVGHVRVLVEVALRLAQAHAVDDRGVVQLVGEDGVFRAEQGLEHAAVRVEAGGVEDGVLHAEEGGQPLLQLAVQGLGPADETHARHPEAPLVEGRVGGPQQLGVARQAEVVVRAEVQDRPGASLDPDLGPLGTQQRPLFLEEALLFDALELGGEELAEGCVHARLRRGFYVRVGPAPGLRPFRARATGGGQAGS